MIAKRPGLVTIVLPTYNRATRLEKAIESCLNQTYRNIELIVVDDGSTDHTGTVLDNAVARDPRMRVIHQDNQGLPRALNAGFRASRGEHLTWTSDDNQYDETAIELMVDALDRYRDVDLVYCDYDLVDDSGNTIGRVALSAPDRLTRGTNCVGACFLYRRRVYEQIGDYDPDVALAEDYDYWLRVHARFRLMRLPDVSPYRYGVHSESLSSTRTVQVIKAIWRARIKNSPGALSKLALYLNSGSDLAYRFLCAGVPLLALGPAVRCWCVAPWGRTRRRVLGQCLRSAAGTLLRQGWQMVRRS